MTQAFRSMAETSGRRVVRLIILITNRESETRFPRCISPCWRLRCSEKIDANYVARYGF